MSKFMLAIVALQLTGGGICAAQAAPVPVAEDAGGASEVGAVDMDMVPGHQVEHPMEAPRTKSKRLIVPSGTGIPVTIDENVAIKQDQIGNTFAAHVTRNVVIDGTIAIPSGAPAELALIENQESPGSASFRLVRISIAGAMRPVRTEVGRADATDQGSSTGKKAGIGAAVGGLVGLITGGGSGLLKGAAIGAGGGLAWGLLDHGSKRVEQGSAMEFTLADPIRVG